jgi:hypothetical protein
MPCVMCNSALSMTFTGSYTALAMPCDCVTSTVEASLPKQQRPVSRLQFLCCSLQHSLAEFAWTAWQIASLPRLLGPQTAGGSYFDDLQKQAPFAAATNDPAGFNIVDVRAASLSMQPCSVHFVRV